MMVLNVSRELLAAVLLPGLSVVIQEVGPMRDGIISVSLDGPDVPQSTNRKVTANIHARDFDGQRWVRVELVPDE